MAGDVLTDDLLRLSLQRLSQEVRKDIPELGPLLAKHLLGTCGLIPAPERASRYRELGQFLIDLGNLYLREHLDLLAEHQVVEEDL
ncbi:hypothetical protein Lesp02_77660 [Lentzea sp. NBRC 105346]|uniref:hypothetical protein n=1 Tax=Lentzea sp. NBRC 105346 TaxID=3032205 RepID=UPI0024A5BF29|nr:hypothetical protein [Lentzea sp. NBRC 105346]GLZ35579.1 hypothetical protein Lesp02_77660 [Lentzea sp. NBRC 105346]